MRGVAFTRDALCARHFAATIACAMALVLLALLSASHLRADPTLPTQTGRITDEAGLLKPEDRSAIDAELADLEQKSTDQVAVVTLKSLQGYTIQDFGIALGRKWGIGQRGKDNGIVLIIAPNEHKIRIEVGRRLEPIMTDLMSKLIIENAIAPAFRKGDFAGGIRAGMRDIKDVLLGDAEAVKERAMGPRRTDSPTPDTMQIILLIFWICVVLYILYAVYRSAQAAQQAGVTRSRRHGTPVFIPGSSDSWGGGWSGGGSGGDSGGGWSGGGGDFGGGGASGSW
jgi:uncharacterized protein